MNTNLKKILCGACAVLMLSGCRFGGGDETTAPTAVTLPQQTTLPGETLPAGVAVEDWTGPVETGSAVIDPEQTTAPPEQTTEPENDSTKPEINATEPKNDPTEPDETTGPDVQTPPETSLPQTGGYDPAGLSYEEYLAMSPAEQQAHYETFPSLEAYIEWHNAALAEYEENQSSIEVTGGFDIGDFMGP